MKKILMLVAVLLLISPTVLADKPDPNVSNPPLQVLEHNIDDVYGAIRVHEQGTVSVDIVNSVELDANITGGQIDADVSGSVVEVITPELTPLMVDDGPFYGIKVPFNSGCNVAFGLYGVSSLSNTCTPGGSTPQIIEQVSVRANLGGAGVSEGFLSVLVEHDFTIKEYEYVVPLKSMNGILIGSQLMRIYVPNNYTVFYEVKLDTAISTGSARIDHSGYRVHQD